jgi:glucokinase
MILAGDIGGTKTNLALYQVEEGALESVVSKIFVSGDYTKFVDILDEFAKEIPKRRIEAACFGVAGPVVNGACTTTNLPWEKITVNDLQKSLGTKHVALINDLAATSYGMLYLDKKDLVCLNPQGEQAAATACVIAAGTGLGEGILYYDGFAYHPMPTEGGHTDFAPQDELEDALLAWLRKRYVGHVSFERVLCGEGIYTLYSFLKEYHGLEESPAMQNIPEGVDKSAMVSRCALEEGDELCQQTLDLFCKIYGGEAGNLALKSLSIGGLFIGGGIAPKILPVLQNGTFMHYFLQKGRFKGLLEKMEVKVSLNQETALIGAAHYAKDKF